MSQDHQEIAACVRIVVKPDRSEEMAALLTRMADLAAGDEGTEIWAVHRGRKGTGEFFLYELFRDRPAFELHQRNEGLNTLGRQLSELADELVVTSGRLLGGLTPRTDGALRQGHGRVNRRRSYIVISSK
jgi:quinol monooxygenase YgiN